MKQARQAVLLALAVLAGACSDGAVAPESQPSQAPVVMGGGAVASLTDVDTIRFSFVIDPHQSTMYYLGAGNTLVIPAGTLCDPKKSTYGVGQWDKPCDVAKKPLTVEAKAWLDRKGHPRVDFQPSLRFVPTIDPLQWVKITFSDWEASQDPFWNILYCRNENATCVDESKHDPSLATMRDPLTGKIMRRIKHFSGYNVAAGDGCDPMADPSCDSGSGMTNVVGVRGNGPGMLAPLMPPATPPGGQHP